MFKRISSTRLAQQVVEQIVQSIQDGTFKDGQKLPAEAELASQFGVSRTCIREALRILEAMGIVRVEHGRGCTVMTSADLSDSPSVWVAWLKAFRVEVLSLLEVREAIESKCSFLAALRRTPEQIKEMENLLNEMEIILKSGKLSIERAFFYDTRFHEMVGRASGNPFLAKLSAGVGGALEADRMATMSIQGRIERSLREHAAILEAIEKKDPVTASELTVQHIREVAEDILSLNVDKGSKATNMAKGHSRGGNSDE